MQKGQCVSGGGHLSAERSVHVWCACGDGDLSAERSVRMCVCVVCIWCACGGGDLSAERSVAHLVHVWWWGLKCRKVSAYVE